MIQIPTHPWSIATDELTQTLKTDTDLGLASDESESRQRKFGENIFDSQKDPSYIAIFARQIQNPLIAVLLIAAVLTLILQEWVDTAIIVFAVLVNTSLGFFQEYKAERAIADLRSYILERTRVLRDGKKQEVDSRMLVPGDIVYHSSGDRITADARILEAVNLEVDEAVLTGESVPVEKHTNVLQNIAPLAERKNMLFAGTVVTEGSCIAVVTAIGYHTEIGALARLVQDTASERTPLQKAISKLAWMIIIGITIIVAMIFFVGFLKGQPLFELLLLCIAIIVSTVPEALPIGLTAVLAVGVERIAKKRGIIRSLTAAETLGSTTLVITDKTGTLTQAQMQLADIVPFELLAADSFDPKAVRKRYSVVQKEILMLAVCNSDVVIEDESLPPAEWVMKGSILEKNLVRAAAIHKVQISKRDQKEVELRLPFSSVHKFSVTRIPAHLLPGAYDQFADPHVVVGAPDVLLAQAHMSKDDYVATQESIATLGEHGHRVLGVGLVTPHISHEAQLDPEHVRDITFLGVLSFVDPVREEVPEALKSIEGYGVQVVMATGDLPSTAYAVGRSLGWDIQRSAVITGDQMLQLSDDDLLEMLPRLRIFARVTPADKVRIAQLYQKRGEVVAMTGDGVNDGPALKAANIGIALGSGTDVAKSIADLVLLDDNFKTIVSTITEGKLMLANIKKIFVYLMSNALDEAILIAGSIIVGVAMPLTAAQIIWVNLFTGSIPAISFAFDRQPLSDTSLKPQVFFDGTVKFLTLGIGLLSSFLLFVLYISLLALSVPVETAQSVIFMSFSAYILVIAFSFRNLEKPLFSYSLFENKTLVVGIGLGLLLIGCTIYMPFFQALFGTTALSLGWILFVVVWLIGNVALVEGAKWISRTYFTP